MERCQLIWISMIYNWLKNNLFKPLSKQCLLCLSSTQNEHLICGDCENNLTRNVHSCVICAIPLHTADSKNTLICGKCQQQRPFYNTSIVPFIYASPLKQFIAGLKFHNNLFYTSALAYIFTRSFNRSRSQLPECIIPVPLHKQRLRERGFNQALELSRIISKQLNVPIDNSLCHRVKATPFQSGFDAKERARNMKNAFIINTHHSYKHVAIFDDVVTTGTTANELAKQLKISGVEMIEVWAIARTENKNT